MIETTGSACPSCGSLPPVHLTGCIKVAWPSEESKLRARLAELEADVELRMKPWQQREIWATMRRAEPAMRDELLSAWHDRDSAIASRDALAEQVEAVRRDALLEAANEVHIEARWQEEQRVRGLKANESIDRLLMLEEILRDRAMEAK